MEQPLKPEGGAVKYVFQPQPPMLRIFPTNPATLQAGPTQHARSVFFICLIPCTYGKGTLTNNYNFFTKKNRNSQITNKNEKNETEEKKGNATVSLLRCIKKYTVLM